MDGPRRPRPRQRGNAAPPAARRSGKDINAKVLRDRCNSTPTVLVLQNSGTHAPSTPTLRRCSGRPRPRMASCAGPRRTDPSLRQGVSDERKRAAMACWATTISEASPCVLQGRRLLRPAQCLPAGRVILHVREGRCAASSSGINTRRSASAAPGPSTASRPARRRPRYYGGGSGAGPRSRCGPRCN